MLWSYGRCWCGLGVWPIGLAGQSSSAVAAAERWRYKHTASSSRYRCGGVSCVVVREEQQQQQHWWWWWWWSSLRHDDDDDDEMMGEGDKGDDRTGQDSGVNWLLLRDWREAPERLSGPLRAETTAGCGQ